ncbi:GntR family transcriptional regulator [Pueribacillus theae]|uniref:GntR family transcriptional regulator n=1 Tax=Pueribacillus theae TaxID=2171751 RepID=A0A2U1JSD8_9BACI|nr:GntR family transcriptional regulator [Pueribacillus theae]PWA07925.1 GntR family transcriptional regulator [Pueribacillus theae]
MKMPIHLSKDSRVPIYHQIEEQMKALIAGGQLHAGTLLPSIRSLSKDLEVSVITTRRAYQNLEYEGFIRTVQGKGTFVADIDDTLKKQVKVSAVEQAFENALDIALRHDYNVGQIEKMFQDVLSRYIKKEKGE